MIIIKFFFLTSPLFIQGASNEYPQHMLFMENCSKLSQNYYQIFRLWNKSALYIKTMCAVTWNTNMIIENAKPLKRQSQQLSPALSSVGYFKSHCCKQCGPRSDCSFRSSLIWVHTVCLYAKCKFGKFARRCSRRHKQTTFSDADFLGALSVKCLSFASHRHRQIV